MIEIESWYLITMEALQGLWEAFLGFVPNLIGALIVLIVGWFIAVGIGKLAAKVLEKARLNQFLEKAGWKEALEKAEIKVDVSGFIGAIFKWVLFIVFLLAAVEILGLVQFADFLTNVLNYLPNVIVAVLIFVVAVIIADIVEKIVRAGVEGARIGYGHIVGVIVKWSIWTFAILAMLVQLKVAPALMQTIFTGLVALMVIGGGLAFGLGGKDIAGEILRDLQRKLRGE